MSSDVAIRIEGLSKCYQIYEQPRDRLLQFVVPRLRKFAGMSGAQYYREFWALRNVSFDVKKGETVGIVGRNGSGKSSLLQIICGTLNHSGGIVQTNGRIAALLELGAGFNPEFTGRENVYMNGAILGLTEDEVDARFDEISAFADIGDFIDQPTKTYSSGMLVRLAFGIAINVEPQVLIIDEALSVGDERFQRKCFARIEDIKRGGATILFVSHSSGAVIELCDRAILLDTGELIAQGQPKRIISAYQKLLYAPDVVREAVREELRTQDFSDIESLKIDFNASIQAAQHSPARSLPEFYDPALLPATTVEYESHGATIEAPAIYSILGEKTNHLNKGRSYRYVYSVLFERSATNVAFGMLIKTVTGFELGGATSAANIQDGIPYVAAGTRLVVSFEFECQLNSGTYFMNAGVMGTIDGEHIYLHRILDACMFRVQPVASNTSTAIIDFRCHASVTEVPVGAVGIQA